MLGNIKDKALQGKEMTTNIVGSAVDNAIVSKDQAGTYVSETTNVVVDKASQIGQATKDKALETAQATKETAEGGIETTGGILQSTGETVMNMAQGAGGMMQSSGEAVLNMAQGATETVKNTLGLGGGTTTTTSTTTIKKT